MTGDDERCQAHRLPADSCVLCRRFGGQPPEPEPKPVAADDQDDQLDDDDRYSDEGLAWWQR